MPRHETLWGNIQEELGETTPNSALGPIRLARRLLLHGAALESRGFAAEHHCSHSVVGQAVAQLRAMGVPIEATDFKSEIGGRLLLQKRYQSTDPTKVPTEELVAAVAEKQRAEGFRKREAARKREARAEAMSRRDANTVRATNTTSAVETAPEPAPPPQERASANNLPALPGLGQSVTIFAMALDEDGQSITIGLRNGEHSWLTRLVGQAER
jgi:predicted DNA-binding transcriptional regulator YafY